MNWLNNSIFNKLLATITIGAFTVLFAAIFTYWESSKNVTIYNDLLQKDIEAERLVGNMRSEF